MSTFNGDLTAVEKDSKAKIYFLKISYSIFSIFENFQLLRFAAIWIISRLNLHYGVKKYAFPHDFSLHELQKVAVHY